MCIFILFRFTVQRQDIQHHSKITRGPDHTEVLQHVVEGEEQGRRVYRLLQETDKRPHHQECGGYIRGANRGDHGWRGGRLL